MYTPVCMGICVWLMQLAQLRTVRRKGHVWLHARSRVANVPANSVRQARQGVLALVVESFWMHQTTYAGPMDAWQNPHVVNQIATVSAVLRPNKEL